MLEYAVECFSGEDSESASDCWCCTLLVAYPRVLLEVRSEPVLMELELDALVMSLS